MTTREIEMDRRLKNAMGAFVASGGDRSAMDVRWWARELECGVEDVRHAWEAAKTHFSTRPPPEDQFGDGK